jgi:hypothetical protein
MPTLIISKKISSLLLITLAMLSLSTHSFARERPFSIKDSAGRQGTPGADGHGTAGDPSEYFAVEDYYRVKWGHADEFIALWKANHYPLLKKALEHGDVISIKADRPRLHSGEDTRWDFRVTVVFRTAALAFDENLTAPYKKQLYPDQDAFTKAEQHRFEILLSHWDVEVAGMPLD